MAQQTLLEMTQDILAALSSDEVNSISDTVESLQVATIIKNKYYDILTRGGLPETKQLFQLTPSTDPSKPVLMFVPDGVGDIDWIKYFDSNPDDGDSDQSDQFGAYSHGLNLDLQNSSAWSTTSSTSNTIALGTQTFTVASGLSIVTGQTALCTAGSATMLGTVTLYSGTMLILNITKITGSGTYSYWSITSNATNSVPGYKYVTILPIDQFLDMVNRFNPAENDVYSFTFTEGGENFTFYYKNDHQPQYCCVLSNYYVIFDMFDITQDTTLQASKTMVFGQKVPTFSLTDTYIPEGLDDGQFPLLLNEAKSLAFYELKQQPHPKADQEIKRQWNTVQKNKSVVNRPTYFNQLADFGRMPRTGGFSGGGYGAYKWMRTSGP